MVEKVPLQIDRRAQVDLLLQGKNEHERGRRKRLFVLRMRKSSERNVRNENSGDKHWRCLLRCFQVLTHRLQLLQPNSASSEKWILFQRIIWISTRSCKSARSRFTNA